MSKGALLGFCKWLKLHWREAHSTRQRCTACRSEKEELTSSLSIHHYLSVLFHQRWQKLHRCTSTWAIVSLIHWFTQRPWSIEWQGRWFPQYGKLLLCSIWTKKNTARQCMRGAVKALHWSWSFAQCSSREILSEHTEWTPQYVNLFSPLLVIH